MVQTYRIEAWIDGTWKPVLAGHAIGHKKIDRFPAVTASRFRLNLLSTAGTARIREFQLFAAEN